MKRIWLIVLIVHIFTSKHKHEDAFALLMQQFLVIELYGLPFKGIW